MPVSLVALLVVVAAACNAEPVPAGDAPAAVVILDSKETAEKEAWGAEDVLAAARAGLPRFAALVSRGQERDYGFADRGELDNAGLGPPYETRAIVHRVQKGAPSLELVPLSEWRVPLVVHGRFAALLTVARAPDTRQLAAVDFGAAGLAAELGAIEEARTHAPKGAPEPPEHRLLLRSHVHRADFAAYLPAGAPLDQVLVLPLRSGRAVLGLDEGAHAADHRLLLTDLAAMLPEVAP